MNPGSGTKNSLADRKRKLVCDELSGAAMTLLTEQGYEATTIDQVVAAAGVSRRTFFRYFQSKEDVFVARFVDAGDQLVVELAARPDDEAPGVALRTVLIAFGGGEWVKSRESLGLVRLILSTPALRGRYLDRQARWRTELADELALRTGLEGTDDVRPMLVAAVGLSVFDVALTQWVAADGARGLDELIEEAFGLLGGILG